MCQLDPGNRSLLNNEIGDFPELFNVFVLPQSEVGGGDAPFRRDRSGFGHDQRRPANSPAAQVHKMPFVRETILTGIFTHRRNRYAILEFYLSDS